MQQLGFAMVFTVGWLSASFLHFLWTEFIRFSDLFVGYWFNCQFAGKPFFCTALGQIDALGMCIEEYVLQTHIIFIKINVADKKCNTCKIFCPRAQV